jgi:hypothetical protein
VLRLPQRLRVFNDSPDFVFRHETLEGRHWLLAIPDFVEQHAVGVLGGVALGKVRWGVIRIRAGAISLTLRSVTLLTVRFKR